MSAPKLPQRFQPPQIPSSMRKGVQEQKPPRSNFFLLLMMTFLFVWALQMSSADKQESEIPIDGLEKKTGVAPVLSEAERQALPKEFLNEAEISKNSIEPTFVTLGSLDPNSPYRFLATLTNRGAAIARIELNEKAYLDNSDNTGYLGQIVVDESLAWSESELGLPGVSAQVVGQGTPAERAGLKQGDRIVSLVNPQGVEFPIKRYEDLRNALLKTKPGDKIKLEVYEFSNLKKNENYNLKVLMLSKLMTNETESSINSLKGSVESNSVETGVISEDDFDESELLTNKSIESTEDFVTASVTEDNSIEEQDFGTTKIIEIELSEAPLSVLRPSGMVSNYHDYVNLVGLQGVCHGSNDAVYLLENRNKDSEPIRKLNSDPTSFLATLARVDDEVMSNWAPSGASGRRDSSKSAPRSLALDHELAGVCMRDGYWDYDSEESNESLAIFKKVLLERQLMVVKKYQLVKVGDDNSSAADSFAESGQAYHLKLSFEVRNYDPNSHRTVAYLLDGPTGLPLEGAWYSAGRKTGPGWGAYGLRDLVASSNNQKNFNVVKCWDVAQDKFSQSDELRIDFLGVDGQYFQCTAIPTYSEQLDQKFAFSPIRVGTRVTDHINFTDVSFRMKSDDRVLAPYGKLGDSFSQDFVVFVGPKNREVMADYGLSKTIVYGWFWFVSIPLIWILHFFHDYIVFNYGLAIVLLTILVRLCLFPLSRKQVLSSMRMQKLQPEIVKLKEKYQDNPQEMMVAQQALFKKYGVNPLSGCLPVFIQMPIFIGLYRALSTDVSLYGAPLFSKGVRWCSNLAAPDMAVNWSSFWDSIGWTSFNMSGRGFLSLFALGPYLNLLPIVTIALFLIQQKLLVPPVVGDDMQARQQRTMRRMMTFMMILMGFMFFKVPSGLCIYFIVSSLWGLLERQMLPKREMELTPVVAVDSTAKSSASAFTSMRDKRRASLQQGRKYETYEIRRDKKGRRITPDSSAKPKSALKQWWDEVVERAKEQQKLAKAEYESSAFERNRKKRR